MKKQSLGSVFAKVSVYLLFLMLVNLSVYSVWASALMCIFAPAFVAYTACEHGELQAYFVLLSAVFFNAAIFLCLDKQLICPSLLVTTVSTVPGILFGVAVKNKFKAFDTLMILSAFSLIFPIIYLAGLRFSMKINIAKVISDTITNTLSVQLETLKTVYPEISERLMLGDDELLSMLTVVIPGIFPCVLICAGIISSAFTFMLCRIACRKSFVRNSVFPEGMDCIALPRITIPVFGLAVIFSFMETKTIVQMAASNMIIVISLLYMLEGLSVAEYILKQRNMNTLLRLFTIFVAFVTLTMFSAAIPILNAPLLAVLLGISDCAGDFRGINGGKEGIR